jgi:diguanylate cyclase (GGDEF)-like protein
MKKSGQQTSHNGNDEDAFLPYRDGIIFSLAIASAPIFLPFSIDNLLEGRLALGVAEICIVLMLAIDSLAIHRGKNPPIPLWTLVFPVLGMLTFAVITPLYIDLAWAYPAIILFYFILPKRIANWLAGMVIVVVTALVYYTFIGTEFHMRVTTRLFAGLTLTAVLSNVFINIISELHRKLQRQAIIDPLTGAFNRRHMDKVLGDVFMRTGRGGTPPALLLIDIDHFKRINDEFGHGTGDHVLKGVVEAIKRHVRSSDALFRCGGEEFALFLPETTTEGAAVAAEQVRKAIAESHLLDHHPVTISIGVASLAPGQTLDDWLRHSDNALYRAKNEGRNRVCIGGGAPSPLGVAVR